MNCCTACGERRGGSGRLADTTGVFTQSGSTAVHPYPVGNRQQGWIADLHQPRVERLGGVEIGRLNRGVDPKGSVARADFLCGRSRRAAGRSGKCLLSGMAAGKRVASRLPGHGLSHEVARNTAMTKPRNAIVQVRRFGGAAGLEVVDAPLPTAGRGEVRVRVLASALEYTDVVIRRHLYPQTMRRRPPFVMGYDVVGEIDQLGDGVRGFQLGNRVADMTVVGSNAAYRTLRSIDLTHVPTSVDVAEAATLILSWTTAYQLLHRAARVQRGQRALVHGAAGAVGQALLVLGKLAGLELWGTARGEHAALVRELGATPIDYQREDFTRVVPNGFDVVFEGIGEDGFRRSFAALKPGGVLCAYGYTANVQAQSRLPSILLLLLRIYLWKRLLSWFAGGKQPRIYSINLMRALHP